MPKRKTDSQSNVLEKERVEIKEPDMYKILLLNDDYTPMDFVVEILISVFHKSPIDATKIMLDVHKKGKGLVGIYPYDIAATKIGIVTKIAREREHPLKSVMEKA